MLFFYSLGGLLKEYNSLVSVYGVPIFHHFGCPDIKYHYAVSSSEFWCKLFLNHQFEVVDDTFCVVYLIHGVLQSYGSAFGELFVELASQFVVLYVVTYNQYQISKLG